MHGQCSWIVSGLSGIQLNNRGSGQGGLSGIKWGEWRQNVRSRESPQQSSKGDTPAVSLFCDERHEISYFELPQAR
jgi:hypothetical protein